MCSHMQIAEVKQQVASTMQTCFQLARLEGPDMQELISASLEECVSLLAAFLMQISRAFLFHSALSSSRSVSLLEADVLVVQPCN